MDSVVELPREQEPMDIPVSINIKTPSQTPSQGRISSQSGTVNQDLASSSAGRVNKDSGHEGGQQGATQPVITHTPVTPVTPETVITPIPLVPSRRYPERNRKPPQRLDL